MSLKLGVIGSNFVSDWLCKAVLETGVFSLAAMYSRKQETGDSFAAKYGIPRTYTDLDAFFSSDLDAVYIASPNICHAQQAIAALRHGKHVLCEKPIATTAQEWKAMEAAAAEHSCVLLEAMRPAFDPAYSVIRENLPRLGVLRRAVFEYCQYSSRYDKFKAGEILNAFNPALGNAAVMDIGVYAFHVCAMLFGKPLSLTSHSLVFPNGMEAMGTAFLPYENFQAEIVYSKITDSVSPSIIMGENGSITIDKLNAPHEVVLRLRGEKPVYLVQGGTENNMIYQVQEFARLIRNGETSHPYSAVTGTVMELLDTVCAQNGIVFREKECCKI